MGTRSLFLLFFAAGIAFIGFAQVYLLRKLNRHLRRWRLRPRTQQLLFGAICAICALMYLPYPLRLIYRWPEQEVSTLVLYGLLYPFSLWGMVAVSTFLLVGMRDLAAAMLRLWRPPPSAYAPSDKPLAGPPCPTRREFLRWSFGAVALSPTGMFTYGAAIGKERCEIVERTVVLPRLSPRLEGLRIAQLTDIHVGNFMKQAKLEWYVRATNDLSPDIVALTGDFIGSSPHFIRACAAALEKLEARHGVFACLGNHDYWVGAQRITEALQAAGVQVLRNEARTLPLKGALLNIAGVDDPWRGKTDFDQALSMTAPNTPTIMLCHQPDLFPAVVRRGVDLTLAGHYHGGQIRLQFLGKVVSPAHCISQFVEGLHTLGRSQLYVSRGIGITGPPVRLNARPEITLLHLA
ncbi:MAG TPA: metallophosphoesterase [Candidatus Tectomicrobia bacterium]|nr:metallophosphoesterase [Candidatus Tectomicrobia bacterium]